MVKLNQTIEDTSPLIIYSPAADWVDGTKTDTELSEYSASTYRISSAHGASASFSFNGTGVWIYGGKRKNHGPYVGTIDGTNSPAQDGFSATDRIQSLLYSATNLDMGPHKVSITNEQVNLLEPYLDIDYISWETDVSDSATVPSYTIDDADPLLVYSPAAAWKADGCVGITTYQDSTCHMTSGDAASVQVTFNGDAVAIYGGVGPRYGPYSVTLDKHPAISFTANSTVHYAKQMLYSASGLGAGNHTLTLVNHPSAAGSVLDIDYFQVLGGGIPPPGTAAAAATPTPKPTPTPTVESATRASQASAASSPTNTDGALASHSSAVVGVGIFIVIAVLLGAAAFFIWHRRQVQQSNPRSTRKLDDTKGSDSMQMTTPTPYRPDTYENPFSSTTRQSELAFSSYRFPGGRHVTGNSVQYTISEPPHAAQSSISYRTTYTGEGSSASGSQPSAPGLSLVGGPPPLSAVGEKGPHAYTGPTVRGGADPFVDPPPSYS